MVEDKKAPEIRFDGFEEPWRKFTLGDAISVVSRPIEMDDDTTYQCVTAKRRNEGIVSRGFFKGSDILVKSQYRIKSGDYIISKRQVVHGANGIVPDELDDAIVSNEYLVFQDSENMNVRFLATISKLHAMYRAFFLSSYGVHIEKLLFDFEDWKKRSIYLPKTNEQQMITSFFRTLDDAIILKKQQYEKTVNIKKAMLEKMFPRNGADVPEIRYDGFTEPWEHRQLSSISDTTYGGGTPNTSKEDYWNGNIPWIQSADVKENNVMSVFIRKKITSKGLENSAAKLIPANSIAIVTRVGVGKLCAIPFEYATSQDILSLSRLKINVKFCAYAIYSKFQAELNAVQGTSIKGVTKDELLRKSIYVPVSSNEQTAIGNFFRNLDTLIEAQREELEKLQNIKKACLNKMFV